jgi:hypothetical protein
MQLGFWITCWILLKCEFTRYQQIITELLLLENLIRILDPAYEHINKEKVSVLLLVSWADRRNSLTKKNDK